MTNPLLKQKGSTLLETIIYAALVTLIIAATVLTVFNAYKVLLQVRINRNLTAGGEAAMERLIREVRQGSSVNLGASTFDLNPGVLVLNTTNAGGNPATITFSVVNGTLNVVDTDGVAYSLGANYASTTLLIFRTVSTSSSMGVKIEMTLVDSRAPARSINFNSTAVLRGSY
ncbi:MAG: hypothetical protein Q7T49_01085 [bacterium]|nr:hypothetical protein [bacterium]